MDDHIEQEVLRIFAFKTESEIEARLIEGGKLFDFCDRPSYVLALRKIDEARLRGTLSQEREQAQSQMEPSSTDQLSMLIKQLPPDAWKELAAEKPIDNFRRGLRSPGKSQRDNFNRAKNAILPLIEGKPWQEQMQIVNEVCAPIEKAKGGKRGKAKSTLVDWDNRKTYSDAVLVKIQQRQNPEDYTVYSVALEQAAEWIANDPDALERSRADMDSKIYETRRKALEKDYRIRSKLRES